MSAKLVELWFYSKYEKKWFWSSTCIIDKSRKVPVSMLDKIYEWLQLDVKFELKYIFDLKNSYAPMDDKRYNRWLDKN
tara:strand:+ start:36 stop:269 length:234 start_codon:yes stop_codon:yes gene_type:complete